MSSGEKNLDTARLRLKTALVDPVEIPGNPCRGDIVLWETECPAPLGLVPEQVLRLLAALPKKPKTPWQEAYDRWLKCLTCSEKRKESLTYAKKLYARFFADLGIEDFTAADVERLKVGLHGEGKKAKTIKHYLTDLRQFFAWCVTHKTIKENPATGIKPPKGESREGVVFSHEEAVKLLNACRDRYEAPHSSGKGKTTKRPPEWLFPFVFLGLRTGLRRSNLRSLKWGQVDLEQRKLSFVAGEMKMRKRHEVPIHAELLAFLKERKEKLNPAPEDPVIGKGINSVNAVFNAACKRVGLEGHRIDDMRHTVETWLAQAGVEQTLRDRILAHENRSGDMTAKYTHWRWEDVVAAVDKLLKLLGKE